MKTCEICGGPVTTVSTSNVCASCNIVRGSTATSKDSSADHVCGCINKDRKNCPLCNKPCHHDTSLNPKILISPM